MASTPIHLQMTGITKRFPGVVALADMHLHVRGGEVLALMGENGAGKSTLMKILGGAYPPDEGALLIDGKPVQLRSVGDAKKLGIALMHQELMLAPNLDVSANIYLGNEPRSGFLNRRAMAASSRALLDRVGVRFSPSTMVSELTAGHMQMVEIAKALALDARVIIMDEPTSSLTAGESENLFRIIGQLKREGIAIIYISHRMEEVFRLADRIEVLRDGRYVGELSREDVSHDRIVEMMVGRTFSTRFAERPAADSFSANRATLKVANIVVPGANKPVSFSANRGEIVGFAGLVGAGRTELMRVIFGVDAPMSGTMQVEGVPYRPNNPRDAIANGVYLAPEDRKRHGLVLPMSVAQNCSLPDIENYRPRFWLNRARECRVAEAEVKRMRIKTPSVNRRCVNLSGGNQQKVVLGKWLAMKPRILILDEPTRGIDVGAKAEIYRTMAELAATGITILMVSSEMEEVLGMSDRIVVMHERQIRAILPRAQATPALIGSIMTGRDASLSPQVDRNSGFPAAEQPRENAVQDLGRITPL